MKRVLTLCLLVVACCGSLVRPSLSVAADKLEYNRDIRPILSNNCFKCHGPDAATVAGNLRLDLREDAVVEAESGLVAILPGRPNESELVRRINAQDIAERMPPEESHKQLTAAEKELLARWINEGAEYKPHWGYVTPTRPEAPQISNFKSQIRNEIDSFIAARLQREGLSMSPEADKTTLIRRVSLDLTGLPPTLAEADAFLADSSQNAYEKVVDRLLASPRYGEHMARYWLDTARYADTNGYQVDLERSMWPWRDWVIRAYNQNMPFDQFTIEQLAGDLLPDPARDQLLATGFNRNHCITVEGGVIDEEYRVEYVMDRVTTTATTWLGLTIGCARCHDHKYDPISQKEFYQFFAYFNRVPETGFGNTGGPFASLPTMPAPTAEQSAQLARMDQQISAVQAKLDSVRMAVDADQLKWENSLLESSGNGAVGGWTVLEPISMRSSGGATLTRLPDQSILASGTNPQKEVYDIVAELPAGALAVRLEALQDKSLPGGGPGRHDNSNFVLTEFELLPLAADGTTSKNLPIAGAVADYSQAGYEIGKAIDGQHDSGWAVDGPTRKLSATAVFKFAAPLPTETTKLLVRLRHEAQFTSHAIGRVRLSATSDPAATEMPPDLPQLLAIKPETRTPEQAQRIRDSYLRLKDPQWLAREKELADLKAERGRLEAQIPTVMIMRDADPPRETFILDRGQYDKPADKVEANVPAALPPLPTGAPQNRLGLARWLVDPSHPLTARVIVNRDWQRYFGVGIVKTAEDFGVQSDWPSHPELLDWLATEFIASGWDVKYMQKMIVLSATYRQSSHVTPALLERDPENRLLARGPRVRLSAETIRDAALAIGGLLSSKLGGPSVYPYQPAGLWQDLNDREGLSMTYKPSHGEDLYRRSMYTFWKRTSPPPTMQAFDAPEREYCVVRRSATNTPLQALVMLNDIQMVEAARKMAERMLTDGGSTVDERLEHGVRLTLARRPSKAELAVLRQAWDQQHAEMKGSPDAARRLLTVGESPANSQLDAVELATWANIARLILNLDEAINKN